MTSTTGSLPRQNFHAESEAFINKQVNIHLNLSYTYLSMAFHFDRDDVALPGLHEHFQKASLKERDHAERLLKYQNSRGGRILLNSISKPVKDDWASPLEALTSVLTLEKEANASLMELHEVAGRNNDANLSDFLEDEFLGEKVKTLKFLSDLITKFKRGGPGLGTFVVDKEFSEQS